MRFFPVVSVLATACVVLAQDETSTTSAAGPSSTCEAQNILDTCVDGYQPRVDACDSNDWKCLCDETENILTCYNNCPKDGGRTGVSQQRDSYCSAAAQLSTTTSTTTSTSTTSTSTRTSTSTSEETASATGDEGATASDTAEDGAGRVEMGFGLGMVGVAVLGLL